ncbi:NADH-quinone oxidoreductase subunit M [Actinomycetospora straminea]|uniref:NADH-quinone oxidoreductase subunit M n=1 Tax=Actinomycetospora straminea TaxID=663607 RepID=A0ABP9E579_9PSEU|nr:NADH-quinone oxidoreductase subunit M [Actinomycetospora straminea]MDD7931401.1 NADH-quinone oxidoreductase subunit M [Actinomycetospora straminea]
MSALLLALLLVPLVGAAVCGALATREDLDRAGRIVGLAFAAVSLVLVVVVWSQFATGPGTPRFQFALSVDWIPAFGTRFALGLDGIALTMIALLAVLVPVVLAFAFTEKLPPGRTGAGFTALILATQGVLVGVFAATDVFLFYVLFEAMLIPMYFVIGRFGGPRRQYAAVKFFLYSFLGGLIMLASVIGLFVASDTRLGEGTFDWTALQGMAAQLPLSTQIWLFLGFFAAFAIKAPLVPFHTWLPDAGAEAPIAGGIILLGLLDKVGTFGFLRYTLPLFPAASQELAPLVLTLAVIGVLYGSLLAAAQTDLKRFVAYTSIAHFGFIALGIFAFSSQSMVGSSLYMVNHGISTAMLFLVVGLLIRRGGTSAMTEYGGVGRVAPLLAGMFLIAGLSTISLPGTNSFISEFLVLLGAFPREPVFSVIATVGIVFAALYMLWVIQRTMTGPLRGAAVVGDGPGAASAATFGGSGGDTGSDADESWMRRTTARFGDLTRGEVAVLTPLVALVLVLGFFPGPVLEVLDPTVSATLSEVGVADPVTPNGVPR